MTSVEKKNKSLEDNAINLNDYKLLKKEFWLYMQGFTKNNAHVKSQMNVFFRHLEAMVFGIEIDINEFGFL